MDILTDSIIQGGAVAIALSTLLYSWKKDQMYNKTINNHLEHMEQAVKDETVAKLKLSNILSKMAKTLERSVK